MGFASSRYRRPGHVPRAPSSLSRSSGAVDLASLRHRTPAFPALLRETESRISEYDRTDTPRRTSISDGSDLCSYAVHRHFHGVNRLVHVVAPIRIVTPRRGPCGVNAKIIASGTCGRNVRRLFPFQARKTVLNWPTRVLSVSDAESNDILMCLFLSSQGKRFGKPLDDDDSRGAFAGEQLTHSAVELKTTDLSFFRVYNDYISLVFNDDRRHQYSLWCP